MLGFALAFSDLILICDHIWHYFGLMVLFCLVSGSGSCFRLFLSCFVIRVSRMSFLIMFGSLLVDIVP